MKEVKTNAMRMLDKQKIPYQVVVHPVEEFHNGLESADVLGVNPDMVYKTIVTTSNNNNYYVFCLPVNQVLDLKKCAKLVGVKNLNLLDLKYLLNLTGYVRGGCSPIGLKKPFPVIIDKNILDKEEIYISAGRIDTKLLIKSTDLIKATNAKTGDIIWI